MRLPKGWVTHPEESYLVWKSKREKILKEEAMGGDISYPRETSVLVKGKYDKIRRRMKIEIDASMPWWHENIGSLHLLPADCIAVSEIKRLYKKAQEIDQQQKDEVEL
jgi:hypothetical protein